MKYSKNKDGWYESEANSEAQTAYEQLKANNRTCLLYTSRDSKGNTENHERCFYCFCDGFYYICVGRIQGGCSKAVSYTHLDVYKRQL